MTQQATKSTVTMPVQELIGITLDWAVAVCQKLPIKDDPMGFKRHAPTSSQSGFWVWSDDNKVNTYLIIGGDYNPSSSWSRSGDIIDALNISLVAPSSCNKNWTATLQESDYRAEGSSGPQAAMRAYVFSVMGETVEVPNRLLRHIEEMQQ